MNPGLLSSLLSILLLACPFRLAAGPEAVGPAAPRSAGAVWHPGVTKEYHVRRYVDPANPRILHGGHVVWRREDDGGWILAPGPEAVEKGPAAGMRRRFRAAAPVAAELAAELTRQRRATAEVQAGAQRVREAQETLAREAAEVARLARELKSRLPGQGETQAAWRAELKQLSERLERLEKSAPPRSIAPPGESSH